jgi:hypothetical protein
MELDGIEVCGIELCTHLGTLLCKDSLYRRTATVHNHSTALNDPCLGMGDLLNGLTQDAGMVQTNIHNDRRLGAIDHIGRVEYKIELIFSETSNTRMIVIQKIADGRLSFEFSEQPNYRLAESLLRKHSIGGSVVSFAYGMLERRLGRREIEIMLESRFSPRLQGISKALLNYQEILDSENKKGQEDGSGLKLIRSIVGRVFGEK